MNGDLTKCSGGECPRAVTCWRVLVPSSGMRQSWFVRPPVMEDGDCDHYIPIEERQP